MTESPVAEFEAIRIVHEALEPLDMAARCRVLGYITNLLDIDLPGSPVMSGGGGPRVSIRPGAEETGEGPATAAESVGAPAEQGRPASIARAGRQGGGSGFADFSALFAAADPDTNAEKALVAGYWLQICLGQGDFDSQTANKALKSIDRGLVNITHAFTMLREMKPSLALPVSKGGKSQQARKRYKLTVLGIRSVEAMTGDQEPH
jgi:hypothetical protein